MHDSASSFACTPCESICTVCERCASTPKKTNRQAKQCELIHQRIWRVASICIRACCVRVYAVRTTGRVAQIARMTSHRQFDVKMNYWICPPRHYQFDCIGRKSIMSYFWRMLLKRKRPHRFSFFRRVEQMLKLKWCASFGTKQLEICHFTIHRNTVDFSKFQWRIIGTNSIAINEFQ